jgi:glucose-1-phosphate cytidylyltransferase
VVEPSVLDLIAGDDSVWETDVLGKLAADGELSAFQHDGYWQPMDTVWEREQLEDQWRTGAAPWKVW